MAIEILDLHTDTGKFSGLSWAKHRPGALICWHRFLVRAFAGTPGHYRHHVLLTDVLFNNCPARLINYDRIGCNLPSDNRLTQPPGSVDHHLVACPCQWICSEKDACRLGGHQLLYNHRQAHILGRDAMARAIVNRARCPERSPAAFYRLQHHRFAVHIEIRLLLTGKRHLRQVFSSGRGTHRDRQLTPAEFSIRLANGPGNSIRHHTILEKPSYLP